MNTYGIKGFLLIVQYVTTIDLDENVKLLSKKFFVAKPREKNSLQKRWFVQLFRMCSQEPADSGKRQWLVVTYSWIFDMGEREISKRNSAVRYHLFAAAKAKCQKRSKSCYVVKRKDFEYSVKRCSIFTYFIYYFKGQFAVLFSLFSSSLQSTVIKCSL